MVDGAGRKDMTVSSRRSVYDLGDLRDERVGALVRVPGHDDDDAFAGRCEDDARVMGDAIEIAGLVCDHGVLWERSRKPVIDRLALQAREHAFRCRSRNKLPPGEKPEEGTD